jgi:hypothetical protein
MPQPPSPTIMKYIYIFWEITKEKEWAKRRLKKPQNNSKQVFILEIE